jgi:hypothetical protein
MLFYLFHLTFIVINFASYSILYELFLFQWWIAKCTRFDEKI